MNELCSRKSKYSYYVKIFRAYNSIIKSITRSFIIFQALLKPIVYKKTHEWYIEWQRVTTSDNEWYNEWQQITSGTMSDNEWYNEWQQMATNDKEWLRVIRNDNEWYNEWQRMSASLEASKSIKRVLQHSCFPMNIAVFSFFRPVTFSQELFFQNSFSLGAKIL